VFSGLPGVGKTTLARALATALPGALFLRIDSLEQSLRAAGWRVEGEGYRAAQAIAEDNLRLGRTVIADCVNPWPLTRAEWNAAGERAGARVINVEVVCSDRAEHRRRVEARNPDLPGHVLPTWDDVLIRDYIPWDAPDLQIDTATRQPEECVRRIVRVCCGVALPGAGEP
jgi:predicted kinase